MAAGLPGPPEDRNRPVGNYVAGQLSSAGRRHRAGGWLRLGGGGTATHRGLGGHIHADAHLGGEDRHPCGAPLGGGERLHQQGGGQAAQGASRLADAHGGNGCSGRGRGSARPASIWPHPDDLPAAHGGSVCRLEHPSVDRHCTAQAGGAGEAFELKVAAGRRGQTRGAAAAGAGQPRAPRPARRQGPARLHSIQPPEAPLRLLCAASKPPLTPPHAAARRRLHLPTHPARPPPPTLQLPAGAGGGVGRQQGGGGAVHGGAGKQRGAHVAALGVGQAGAEAHRQLCVEARGEQAGVAGEGGAAQGVPHACRGGRGVGCGQVVGVWREGKGGGAPRFPGHQAAQESRRARSSPVCGSAGSAGVPGLCCAVSRCAVLCCAASCCAVLGCAGRTAPACPPVKPRHSAASLITASIWGRGRGGGGDLVRPPRGGLQAGRGGGRGEGSFYGARQWAGLEVVGRGGHGGRKSAVHTHSGA